MYVAEAKWYQKQQKRRLAGRTITMCFTALMGLVLISLCFCVLQVWAKDRMAVWQDSCGGAQASVAESLDNIEDIETRKSYGKVEAELFNQGEIMGEQGLSSTKNVAERENEGGTDAIMESETMPEAAADEHYLIVIDAGHGGEDEGCSAEGLEEKDINLYLAVELKDKLEALEFRVLLTRSDDKKVSLEERVKLANETGAHMFISIHQNCCEDSGASGIETYYYQTNEGDNERLARLVEQYVVLYTKGRDRGIREADNLYVIRETNMPSCLVETGFLSNIQERELLQTEDYLDKIVQGLADAVELYFYPKEMYLTFDDGPVAGNTDVVLDILKEKGIKATFFVVGKNVEKNPELAKRIVEEGHTIGIHCYQHDYGVLYESVDSYLEDFEKARQVVKEVTGVETKLFRFPGGSINSYSKKVYRNIIAEMTAQGYVYFDWNASFEDAVRGITMEKIMENAKSSTLGRKKVVMLAHDMVDATVECLEDVLKLFPEYEMLPITDEVEVVQF